MSNTYYLDLKFIQNKGLYLKLDDLYHLTVDRYSGKLKKIDKDKKNLNKKNEEELILYNKTFYELIKAFNIEKYWYDINRNQFTVKGDIIFTHTTA